MIEYRSNDIFVMKHQCSSNPIESQVKSAQYMNDLVKGKENGPKDEIDGVSLNTNRVHTALPKLECKKAMIFLIPSLYNIL